MGLAYGTGVQYVSAPAGAMGDASPPAQMADRVVVDGTPLRVVIICLAAAAGLTALRWGGLRFNVGVSS